MENKVNGEYVIQSLINQIAESSRNLAEREAVITEQYQRIQEFEKELEKYRNKEIKEMDKAK